MGGSSPFQSKVHRAKAEAQAAGRETAKRDHVEHLIHNADGEIGSRNSLICLWSWVDPL